MADGPHPAPGGRQAVDADWLEAGDWLERFRRQPIASLSPAVVRKVASLADRLATTGYPELADDLRRALDV